MSQITIKYIILYKSTIIICDVTYYNTVFRAQITGTGHGIGKCLALQFADVCSKVVCVDINEQSNAETVKEINAKWKGKAFAYT